MSKKYNLSCNIAGSLDIIGDRWTLLVIRELISGSRKFNELKGILEGIAPNILSDRLQLLEAEGILTSSIYSKHPPRYEYALTDKGKDLKHVIHALALWGNKYMETKYINLVHADCGHPIEITYHCEHCSSTTKDIRTVPAQKE